MVNLNLLVSVISGMYFLDPLLKYFASATISIKLFLYNKNTSCNEYTLWPVIFDAMISPNFNNNIDKLRFLITFEIIFLKLYESSIEFYKLLKLVLEFSSVGLGELDCRLCVCEYALGVEVD